MFLFRATNRQKKRAHDVIMYDVQNVTSTEHSRNNRIQATAQTTDSIKQSDRFQQNQGKIRISQTTVCRTAWKYDTWCVMLYSHWWNYVSCLTSLAAIWKYQISFVFHRTTKFEKLCVSLAHHLRKFQNIKLHIIRSTHSNTHLQTHNKCRRFKTDFLAHHLQHISNVLIDLLSSHQMATASTSSSQTPRPNTISISTGTSAQHSVGNNFVLVETLPDNLRPATDKVDLWEKIVPTILDQVRTDLRCGSKCTAAHTHAHTHTHYSQFSSASDISIQILLLYSGARGHNLRAPCHHPCRMAEDGRGARTTKLRRPVQDKEAHVLHQSSRPCPTDSRNVPLHKGHSWERRKWIYNTHNTHTTTQNCTGSQSSVFCILQNNTYTNTHTHLRTQYDGKRDQKWHSIAGGIGALVCAADGQDPEAGIRVWTNPGIPTHMDQAAGRSQHDLQGMGNEVACQGVQRNTEARRDDVPWAMHPLRLQRHQRVPTTAAPSVPDLPDSILNSTAELEPPDHTFCSIICPTSVRLTSFHQNQMQPWTEQNKTIVVHNSDDAICASDQRRQELSETFRFKMPKNRQNFSKIFNHRSFQNQLLVNLDTCGNIYQQQLINVRTSNGAKQTHFPQKLTQKTCVLE